MKLVNLIPILALSSTCYAGITAPFSGASSIPAAGVVVTDTNTPGSTPTTLSIDTAGSAASNPELQNFRFGGTNDNSGFLVATFNVTATGGDARAFKSPGDNAPTRIKGIKVELGAGVTEFEVSVTFNRYLHSQTTEAGTTRRPLLLAARYITAGANDAGTSVDYTLKQSYSQIASISALSAADQTIANGIAVTGLPTTNPTDLIHSALGTLGSPTIAIAGSGHNQEYIVTSNQSAVGEALGTRSISYAPGFAGRATDQGAVADFADLTDGLIQGGQQISARTVTFTMTSASTFREGAIFDFSMDGRQEVPLQNVLSTPEPASITFLAIGGLCLMGRRKRR